jgi:microcystin-dependent protein
MPGFPAPFIKFREDDANGFPLAGGKLYSYMAGSSTPLATYTTQALDVPNTNPTILDASGRASVYLEDGVGYKFVLHDALDNVIWSEDNVQVPAIAAPTVPAAVPPGSIVMFGGTTLPPGWLWCDGASTSTTAHPDLFAAILYTHGGAGATFNVPDLRQRFPLGKALAGTGVMLGSTGGQIDHTHSVPKSGWIPQTLPAAQAIGWLLTTIGGAANVDVPLSDSASGPANPPFLALNFIIKT